MIITNNITRIKRFNIALNIFLYEDGKLNNREENVDSFVTFEKELLLIYNKGLLSFPNIPINYGYKNFSASKSHIILFDRDSIDLSTFTHTKEAIYSLKEQKIIFEGSIIGNRIINEYVINGIGKTYISIFSIDKKNVISTLSLSSLGKCSLGGPEVDYQVREFCGIYEKTLVCTMNNGAVLLLDIEKGEVLAFFNEAGVSHNLQQINESEVFQGIYGYTFLEINVKERRITREINLKSEWNRLGREQSINTIGVSIYAEGKHYFIAKNNVVGVFNPDTEKIEDFHVFNFDLNKGQQLKGGKENLQVKDGKIYCLDTLGNLYELGS